MVEQFSVRPRAKRAFRAFSLLIYYTQGQAGEDGQAMDYTAPDAVNWFAPHGKSSKEKKI